MEKGYCIIKEVNELHKADALDARERTAEEQRGWGERHVQGIAPFFNVRRGQEVPSSW